MNEEIPEIFNAPLINRTWDKLWEDDHSLLSSLSPHEVLILSRPLDPDGSDAGQLSRILEKCKITPDRYDIVYLREEDIVAWTKLRERVQPKVILVFGVGLQQLGLSVQFMSHQLARFDGRSWIYTHSLDQLSDQPDIKRHLWEYGLKPVFEDRAYG